MQQCLRMVIILSASIIIGCASTQEIKDPIAITERPVVERKKTVLYVFHDDDGDWQFLSSEDSHSVEVFTLPLNEMFDFDTRLKEINDLPIGWRANWNDTNKTWERINPKDLNRYKGK